MSGCSRELDIDDPGTRTDTPPPSAVIGAVAGKNITLSETERSVSLQLYDIDMQRYRLLRNALESALLKEIEASGDEQPVAEVRL